EQPSNDGMKKEAIFAASVSLASHVDGYAGVDCKTFVKSLVAELCAKDDYKEQPLL
ncbi:hypothetical protein HDU91_001506, partial [Kappamyces sp. JEL0680]